MNGRVGAAAGAPALRGDVLPDQFDQLGELLALVVSFVRFTRIDIGPRIAVKRRSSPRRPVAFLPSRSQAEVRRIAMVLHRVDQILDLIDVHDHFAIEEVVRGHFEDAASPHRIAEAR